MTSSPHRSMTGAMLSSAQAKGSALRLLFKGGTSLSKAFGLISRFSEDIDITVFREDIGETASVETMEAMSGKKRQAKLDAIKQACQGYIGGAFIEQLSLYFGIRRNALVCRSNGIAHNTRAPSLWTRAIPSIFKVDHLNCDARSIPCRYERDSNGPVDAKTSRLANRLAANRLCRVGECDRWHFMGRILSARRLCALRFENACSIGLKSGLPGGRRSKVVPVASIASQTSLPLWPERLSMRTKSLGPISGTSAWWT